MGAGRRGNGIAMGPEVHAGTVVANGGTQPGPRPDRRVATVLFCDIVGSTRFVAAEDPEEANDRLASLLEVMGRHVRRFGGTLCQTLGDGILAVFGAPNALEDHAVRACFAGDAIVGEVARRQNDHAAAVRVGIAAGEILWDNAALGGQSRPPAVGRPVHLAAKAQQQAQPNSVRLSDAVYALAGDWIEVQPAGRIELTPTDRAASFELTGLRRRRVRLGESLPLAGREDSLAELSGALDDVVAGRGGFHLLVGDAGMGKSRLAAEVARLAQARGVRVVDWMVPAVRALGAPEPVLELLAELLRTDLPPSRDSLSALLEGDGVPGPQARALADMAYPDQAARQGGEGRLRLAADGVATLARQAAANRPLLLLVEDLHWAGTDVQAVIAALATLPGSGPLLILATSRDGAAWLAAPKREHRLAALSRDSAHDLLDRLVGGAPELADLKRTLVDRAQGNPFFLVESVRSLREDGTLLGMPGALYQAAPLVARVPETVQGLLASRIDALPLGQKTLLLMASVIGPTFDVELLAALRERSRSDIAEDLALLSRAGLIDETRLLPRLEYSFAHALLHESAYGSLTKKHRKQLHGTVVELLETSNFSNLVGRAQNLASHSICAENWIKAAEWGSLSATELLGRAHSAEAEKAIAGAKNAMEHIRDSQEGVNFEIGLGLLEFKLYFSFGKIEESKKVLYSLSERVQNSGSYEQKVSLFSTISSFNHAYGSMTGALHDCDRCIELIGGDDSALRELSILKGIILTELGSPDEAINLLQSLICSSDHTTVHGKKFFLMDLMPICWAEIARNQASKQQATASRDSLDRAFALAQHTTNPFELIYVRVAASEVSFLLKEFELAREYSSGALSLMARTNMRLLEPVALAWRSLACAALGSTGWFSEASRAINLARERQTILQEAWAIFCLLKAREIGPSHDPNQKVLSSFWNSEYSRLLEIASANGYGRIEAMMSEVQYCFGVADAKRIGAFHGSGGSKILHPAVSGRKLN